MVSFKNFYPSISEQYLLIYSYAILSLCSICLIVSVIRFIYEWNYGLELI